MEKFLTTGHERDVETEFDYRGARYYDAEYGRFLSVDPLASEFAGWSSCNYGLVNPTRYSDPTGRAPEEAGNKNDENSSGWTYTNVWLATAFNGSLGEYMNQVNQREVWSKAIANMLKKQVARDFIDAVLDEIDITKKDPNFSAVAISALRSELDLNTQAKKPSISGFVNLKISLMGANLNISQVNIHIKHQTNFNFK